MSIKKATIILLVLAAILSIAFFIYASNKKTAIYTTVPVKTGKIIQTVNETGTVKSESELNLSFLNTGRIDKINYNVGDFVKKDSVLAVLDISALLINKNEAEANLNIAQTSLSKLLAGATREDVAIARANLEQAEIANQSAKNELEKTKALVAENISQATKTLSDLESKTSADITTYEQSIISAETSLANTKTTYQKAIDDSKQNALVAVNDKLTIADNALDVIDNIINDDDAKDFISVKDYTYLDKTKSDYNLSTSLLNQAKTSLGTYKLTNTNSDLTILLGDASETLDIVFKALLNCYSALEYSVISASKLTQTELDAFKADIIAQQTLITAAITSVQSAEHNFNNAILSYGTNVTAAENTLAQSRSAYDNAFKSAVNALSTAKTSGQQQITTSESRANAAQETLRLAQAQYNKTIAPADKYDISLAQGKIKQAQSLVDSINKQLENSTIKSPIDGTVTKVNFKAGEQVLAGNSVFSVLKQNKFEIEVLISEADIAKVKKGQKSIATLDAYGDDVKFDGDIYFIEPAETNTQGVVYYKVKINFNSDEREVKSGMTANATIITAQKENILIIPTRAVIEKNGQGKIDRILNNNNLEERPVTIGLQGDEGVSEIISGLKDGESVVTFIKEK